ncbi:MAG TPA: hypothetical protein VK993_14905 [Chthoniobacterales bacterium]|nr:hypothetical protein [Chthoniobacterales bacterium]
MKKLTFTCTTLLVASALQLSVAAEVAPGTASTAPAQSDATADPAAPPTLELANKSSFEIQGGRNPFWPIGWKPAAKATTAEPTEQVGPEVPPTAFVVSSIVMDPRARFAIINGKVMNEGQVFGLQMGSSTYQITVKAIEDGRVILVRGRDTEIVVPLRRR